MNTRNWSKGHPLYRPERMTAYEDGRISGLRQALRESVVITAAVGLCCFVLGFCFAYVVTWGV